ncbi:GntR family transcriptional regulator [Salibacterium aidingense]|uniref:GntR family transcriptional regulator n=1 Tax=Salibacterium aidingense TaxID=384933 RepID=UPI003BBF7839
MNIKELTNKDAKSMRNEVYASLRREITSLKLEPGCPISENDISKRLQVSRTPVREAFLRLSQEDLITVYPQKTTIVSLIDLDQLEETRFMREYLEAAVARSACERLPEKHQARLASIIESQKEKAANNELINFYKLDDEFHASLYEGCDKQRILTVVQDMMSKNFNRVRVLSLSEKLNTDIIISQHEEMLNAIKAQDKEAAEQVVRKHLQLVTIDREELEKKFPGYFK